MEVQQQEKQVENNQQQNIKDMKQQHQAS